MQVVQIDIILHNITVHSPPSSSSSSSFFSLSPTAVMIDHDGAGHWVWSHLVWGGYDMNILMF